MHLIVDFNFLILMINMYEPASKSWLPPVPMIPSDLLQVF